MFNLRIGDTSVTVNAIDRPALLDEVRSRVRQGSGFAVATVNLDHLVKLRTSGRFSPAPTPAKTSLLPTAIRSSGSPGLQGTRCRW